MESRQSYQSARMRALTHMAVIRYKRLGTYIVKLIFTNSFHLQKHDVILSSAHVFSELRNAELYSHQVTCISLAATTQYACNLLGALTAGFCDIFEAARYIWRHISFPSLLKRHHVSAGTQAFLAVRARIQVRRAHARAAGQPTYPR